MKKFLYIFFLLYGCSSVDKEEELITVNESQLILSSNFENPLVKNFVKLDLAPKEYSKWVNNRLYNPLIKARKINEITYQLKYIPVAQMINNELRQSDISEKEFDSLYNEYSGMEYYELKLSIENFNEEIIKYNLTEINQYQERIVYMSFKMQDDIKLKYKDKVIPCGLYHFERSYGVAPHAKILLGFSVERMDENIKERTIEFDDKLFNKGLIKYHWKSEDLQNIPKIKIS